MRALLTTTARDWIGSFYITARAALEQLMQAYFFSVSWKV